MAHRVEDYDAVTDHQKKVLFPLLQSELDGSEASVLDFGCGPGRFTAALAELVDGKATGVDITSELLALAPKLPSVKYECIDTATLPFPDSSFDVVWSCLVLGGIPDGLVEQSISEIQRVLKPNGLFFFVENTEAAANMKYWFFRSKEAYLQLADFSRPRVVGQYADAGQTISVFAGRKANSHALK